MKKLPRDTIVTLLSDTEFVVTFSGVPKRLRSAGQNQKVTIRTADYHGVMHLQMDSFTERQHFSRHEEYSEATLLLMLDEVLSQNFVQVHVQRPDFDHYFRCTGQHVRSKRAPASRRDWSTPTSHNSTQHYHITPANASALLEALGMSDAEGAIVPSMYAKYRQINHFISIVLSLKVMERDTLSIVDCGCGKAYLSLALFHYLTRVQSKSVRLVGVDSNEALIEFCTQTARKLGYDTATFHSSTIAAFEPDMKVDFVIALHACDTATDDALALAVRGQVEAIVAAPCCHHYLNEKLRPRSASDSMAAILRDGISRERFADLLTDTMRRDILRVHGYRAELIEFVAQEHTAKNIMIRAERIAADVGRSVEIRDQLNEAFQRWQAAPKLAELVAI